MYIFTFIREQKQLLDDFESWWIQKHYQISEEEFPLHLDAGEWDEQIQMYEGKDQ